MRCRPQSSAVVRKRSDGLPADPGSVQGRPHTSETLTSQRFPDFDGRLRTTANGRNGCPSGTVTLRSADWPTSPSILSAFDGSTASRRPRCSSQMLDSRCQTTPTPPAFDGRCEHGYEAPNIRGRKKDDELHQELVVIAALQRRRTIRDTSPKPTHSGLVDRARLTRGSEHDLLLRHQDTYSDQQPPPASVRPRTYVSRYPGGRIDIRWDVEAGPLGSRVTCGDAQRSRRAISGPIRRSRALTQGSGWLFAPMGCSGVSRLWLLRRKRQGRYAWRVRGQQLIRCGVG
jgi:hypothetical protein